MAPEGHSPGSDARGQRLAGVVVLVRSEPEAGGLLESKTTWALPGGLAMKPSVEKTTGSAR